MAKRGRKTNEERERMRLELEEQEKLADEEPEVTDREQIYNQYEGSIPQPETTPAEVEQETVPEEPEPETTPVEVEEEKKEEKPVTEEEKIEAEKVVASDKVAEENRNLKAALKESRVKKQKLKEQLAAYEQKKPEAREEDPEPIYDLEAKIREQDEQIKNLRQVESERTSREQKQQVNSAKQQLQKTIDKVDKELEDEGYGGFRLLVGNVTEELSQMMQQKLEEDEDIDADLFVRQHDNPDTWKDIFKNKVFPVARDIIVKTNKTNVLEEKRKAKEQANLITTSGKSEKPAEEKSMTAQEELQDYVKTRRERAI